MEGRRSIEGYVNGVRRPASGVLLSFRQKKSLAAILGEGNDCAAREACRPDVGGEIRDSKKLRISEGTGGSGVPIRSYQ